MADTGDLRGIGREIKFEWEIKNFLQLSDKINTYCESPEFDFLGISWRFRIYPNGETGNASGWIGLYVMRKSADIPITLDYSFSLKSVDGKPHLDRPGAADLDQSDIGCGFSKFVRRSVLIERKSELLPSGILTALCTLKSTEKTTAVGNEGSKKACVHTFAQTNEGTGVWKLQQNLGEIFSSGNVSDLVLKVDDQEFRCHRCILAARSPVFLAMLMHETKEKNTGVVDIPDADPNTFSDFLNYLYTGNMEIITSLNVVKLYTSADKYQVDELKKVCVDYMLKNMTVDNFCDFLTLSLHYVEKDLTDTCSQFFIENSLSIVLTSKWQMFLNENPVAGNELYIKQLQLNK